MNKNPTAIEWFAQRDTEIMIDFLENKLSQLALVAKKMEILQQAKQMEKEQIIKANRDGVDMVLEKKYFISGEKYYKQTFEEKS